MKKRTNEESIQYPPAIIGVRPSLLLKGEVGLFALRALPKETLIAKAEDIDESVLIPWDKFRRLDCLTRQRLKMFCMQTKVGVHAPRNINQLSIPWHINHSCSPNVHMDKFYNYRTSRAVRRGEELFIDFGTFMDDPRWRLKCRCGEPNCIGVIKPRQPDA